MRKFPTTQYAHSLISHVALQNLHAQSPDFQGLKSHAIHIVNKTWVGQVEIHIPTHMYVCIHHENKSPIRSLTLMHLAIIQLLMHLAIIQLQLVMDIVPLGGGSPPPSKLAGKNSGSLPRDEWLEEGEWPRNKLEVIRAHLAVHQWRQGSSQWCYTCIQCWELLHQHQQWSSFLFLYQQTGTSNSHLVAVEAILGWLLLSAVGETLSVNIVCIICGCEAGSAHNLRVIQDKLVGGDHSWDTLVGPLYPSLCLCCVLTLGPPTTLVLHSTPATQRVVLSYTALTVSEVSTFFQRDLEDLGGTEVMHACESGSSQLPVQRSCKFSAPSLCQHKSSIAYYSDRWHL